jgi:hypothetical protein
VDGRNVKTKKKILYVETFLYKANMQLQVVKEIGNKILIKTWKGFTELTLNEKENCWIVTNEFNKEAKLGEWENFIVWEE